MNFKKNILLYTLIPLLVLFSLSSYYRFVVLSDYTVSYKLECDPNLQECFYDCADTNCSSEYYFTLVSRYAPDLLKLCGVDITGCETANYCGKEELKCKITYCESGLGDSCKGPLIKTDI